ncbi:MAG: hypothetical protein ACR2LM_12975 [Pyrinomonadaceae bacterium]
MPIAIFDIALSGLGVVLLVIQGRRAARLPLATIFHAFSVKKTSYGGDPPLS